MIQEASLETKDDPPLTFGLLTNPIPSVDKKIMTKVY